MKEHNNKDITYTLGKENRRSENEQEGNVSATNWLKDEGELAAMCERKTWEFQKSKASQTPKKPCSPNVKPVLIR